MVRTAQGRWGKFSWTTARHAVRSLQILTPSLLLHLQHVCDHPSDQPNNLDANCDWHSETSIPSTNQVFMSWEYIAARALATRMDASSLLHFLRLTKPLSSRASKKHSDDDTANDGMAICVPNGSVRLYAPFSDVTRVGRCEITKYITFFTSLKIGWEKKRSRFTLRWHPRCNNAFRRSFSPISWIFYVWLGRAGWWRREYILTIRERFEYSMCTK